MNSTRQVDFITDTLVWADKIAEGFQMEGADIHVLNENDGFGKILALIRAGKVDIAGYSFLMFLCRKSDLVETDRYFKQSVFGILDLLKTQHSPATLVFTATIPMPGDSKLLIRTANYRAGFLEFSRPGKRLLKPGGVIAEFYDDFGQLNQAGLQQLRQGLTAKFA